MSTSTWGELEPFSDDIYPPALLKYFLKQVITQFGAHGACMAVYHESTNQMVVQAHIRLQHLPSLNNLQNFPSSSQANQSPLGPKAYTQKTRCTAISLHQDQQSPYATSSPESNLTTQSPNIEGFEDVTPEQSGLFAVGTPYPLGHDLIGYSWQKNETLYVRHEDYAAFFPSLHPFAFHIDIIPTSYLVIPIQETTLIDEIQKQQVPKHVMGILVLYQVTHTAVNMNILSINPMSFHPYIERIALYLQNDQLQRAKRRTSEYLQLLQNISTVFPSSVKLGDLVEYVYSFVSKVVDISSMLLTLYDRDLKKLYDVFALRNGQQIEGLVEQPVVRLPEDRPVWWHVTQNERQTLQFSPREDQQQAKTYAELLTGIWGDQISAGSFLLLPMKMFTRVIGALCLTSEQPHAYHPEEIQVLETMVQIVTVSVENAKLYERDRDILYRTTQREQQLALVNSALQAISSSLNVTELLNNLVEAVAHILRVNMCVFFELTSDQQDFFAHALYAPQNVHMYDDGSGMPIVPPQKKKEPDELITTIRLPFKDTMLEQRIFEGFFYMEPAQLEELALKCREEGAIFLREIGIHYILIIPMHTQNKVLGFLAVPVPTEISAFRPKDVGTLLTICAQTANAIRNAQIFEEREEVDSHQWLR
jgi:GAF domain-containing protein